MRSDFGSITHRIAIPTPARTKWTHSDAWSQLPTTPHCLFTIEDWWCGMKRSNCNRRKITNMTRGLHAGLGVFYHRGVSDASDGAIPPGQDLFLLMVYADISSNLKDVHQRRNPVATFTHRYTFCVKHTYGGGLVYRQGTLTATNACMTTAHLHRCEHAIEAQWLWEAWVPQLKQTNCGDTLPSVRCNQGLRPRQFCGVTKMTTGTMKSLMKSLNSQSKLTIDNWILPTIWLIFHCNYINSNWGYTCLCLQNDCQH